MAPLEPSSSSAAPEGEDDQPRSTKKQKTSVTTTEAAAAAAAVVASEGENDGPSSSGSSTTKIDNYVDGSFRPPSSASSEYLPVSNPSTSSVVGSVALSSSADVDAAVSAAREAFPSWSSLTTKSRASLMLRFHSIVRTRSRELAESIVKENGKNITEALAEVAKGNETVEYACTLPSLAGGRTMEVSSGGVSCRDVRRPLGVVSSVVPFNFPFMVPMWTLPIALVCGNTVVLKPSEKVPLTMAKVAGWFEEAGFPKGVVNLVNGRREVVESLIDHDDVRAVTFVGSSPVAESVARRCRSLHKRVVALGGAKNHLVALPDCDVESTSSDVVASFAGCAGQRCMAASVLLIVGKDGKVVPEGLLPKVVEKARKIEKGTGPGQMGPVIDGASHGRILKYVREAEERGAEVLLDGRRWADGTDEKGGGCWIGPTILKFSDPTDPAMTDEIFGPVLSVHVVSSESRAVEIENSNPYGNAAAVYTTNGGSAERLLQKFRAAMLGVNVGIPVPREPFSFGGLCGTKSKYGDMDITGDGATEFFTDRIKVTTRWPEPTTSSSSSGASTDRANFAGQM